MFEELRNLKILETIYANSSDYVEVKNRPNHIIVTRLSGKCEYLFDDRKVIIEAGESILLPKGLSYSVRRISEEPSRCALLRFSADADFLKPTEFKVDNLLLFISAFDKLGRALLFDNEKNLLLSLSHFYELLSLLSPKNERTYLDSRKLELIEPALTYLEEHIFDPKLVIGKLSLLCGISDVYLRQIFFQHTGKQLSKYITEKRLDRAKRLLDDGDYTFVRDVAEAVGYTDPLYFSRIFKKRYGYSPRANAQFHNSDK